MELHACNVARQPPEDARARMLAQCSAEWMAKLTEDEQCVKYMTGLADPSCNVEELQRSCQHLRSSFRVQHAQELCKELDAAHGRFWPQFWGSTAGAAGEAKEG